MDHTAAQIRLAVDEVTTEVQNLLKDINLSKLPCISIDSVEACDRIPPGIACLYFVHHPHHGLLYIGKAANLRLRWRAAGRVGRPYLCLMKAASRR